MEVSTFCNNNKNNNNLKGLKLEPSNQISRGQNHDISKYKELKSNSIFKKLITKYYGRELYRKNYFKL